MEATAPAAVTRRRGPLPAPSARRRVREGRTSALLVLPSPGGRGASPASDETESLAPVASQHDRSLAGFALHPRGGNRKARFPPRTPLSRPLRCAMGRCLPSRPRPTVRDQRQQAFPPMVGDSTQAAASDPCELTVASSKSQAPALGLVALRVKFSASSRRGREWAPDSWSGWLRRCRRGCASNPRRGSNAVETPAR